MEFPNPVALFVLLSCFLVSHVCAERSVYIVHMDKSLMPMPFSSHHHWYSSILTSALQTSSDTDTRQDKLIYVYDHAFHGFSALLSEDQVEALNQSPGVLSAYRDSVVTADTTYSVDFMGLSSAIGLWPAAKYGEDAIIGVIDSGIWPENPSFRDYGIGKVPAGWKGICQEGEQFNSSMCNRKLIGARYFNQGIRAADPNITIPMNSARDIDGHGSHVASIAAGNFVDGVSYFGYAKGTARGVAPRARLAVYKGVWNGGGVGSDLLAGIDQAVADGVDIISISLGLGPNNLYENPLSIASFGAREKGIVVCFSAGNRGPGIRTIREKAMPWGIVVAAGTVDRWFAGTLTLGNGKSIRGWTLFPGRATVKNVPIVYNQTLAVCDSILAEVTEKVIIICNLTQESASFDTIMSSLPLSKAQAAIIIGENLDLFESTSFSYPATVISPAEGQPVIDYVSNTATPRATIAFQQTIIGQRLKPTPALGHFSSKGPPRSYEGILKPDIMAPGVLILAAYSPLVPGPSIGNVSLFSNYSLQWGTSMACPHISGVAALLKAAHPDWSPSAIQSAMMTTANPLDSTKQPIKEEDGSLALPLGIGSGQVDPNRALNPGLVYNNTRQDFVNFVCALNLTRQQTQTLIRSNYNCSNPSSDLNYPSFVATFQPPEEGLTVTRRFQRTLTNVGNSVATYKVRVEAPMNSTISIKPRKLVFRKKYEELTYSF